MNNTTKGEAMITLSQNGFTLTVTDDKRRYSFRCDATGKGYGFGACHSECVDAFDDNSLADMIESYGDELQ